MHVLIIQLEFNQDVWAFTTTQVNRRSERLLLFPIHTRASEILHFGKLLYHLQISIGQSCLTLITFNIVDVKLKRVLLFHLTSRHEHCRQTVNYGSKVVSFIISVPSNIEES